MKCLSENIMYLKGKMTISELAKKVNIPQPTLSRYILCQRQITLDNLIALADFFNVDIDILVGRKEF